MLPFKLVYHDGYDLHLGSHVFPSKKYKMVRGRLLKEGVAEPGDFVTPEPATEEDLLLVHERGWITRLREGTLDYMELMRLEIPYSHAMVNAFILAAGGTILAARSALRDGVGVNIGGGFHHAFPDHGEGFCAIHDVAVGIRRAQKDGLIQRAMVVDTDVHQGNGTAAIFASDESVFTLSIHQFNNYPSEKPPSDVDIDLQNGVGDDEYCQRLGEACRKAMDKFSPQLVMYVAGADPYGDDQLGGLALTIEGLKRRDRLVFDLAREHGAPVAVTFAGGYAHDVEDTVTIHTNTVKAAAECLCHNRLKEVRESE
jgi:acetoin utilization deacetylase AcuC-like enzyme